ncbi:MAG: hypothetical protein H6754_07685 [Candidatus Omnitrophica bacterium]|nr:hypothetical protein [Candidatus Omnitrophota bacterium]
MSSKVNRNFFSISNKYQMQVILLLVSPLLVFAFAMTIAVYTMSAQVDRLLSQQSYAMVGGCIAQWFYITVCFIFIALVTFLTITFKFSQSFVSPFSRILKEIDDVLATGKKRIITARPDDEFANDVLTRINALIARIS